MGVSASEGHGAGEPMVDAATGQPLGGIELTAGSRAARALVSAPIVFYQRVISPGLPRRCKYEPTCSRYAIRAIKEYGILRGLVLAAWRLLRCNPWSRGGYDPVEAQGVFRTCPRHSPDQSAQRPARTRR
jgi:putative membrane protein insertion efficiency factor